MRDAHGAAHRQACGYLSERDVAACIADLDGIIPVLWTLAYRR